MQIFVTNKCPKISAHNLDDKRVIKMVLESAQLLSTALHHFGRSDLAPYKSTHINHPCTKWAVSNLDNYHWLLEHFQYLLEEYTSRYGRKHKCGEYTNNFTKYLFDISYIYNPPSSFANCTPYSNINVFLAYQTLLADKWENDKRTPTFYGKAA